VDSGRRDPPQGATGLPPQPLRDRMMAAVPVPPVIIVAMMSVTVITESTALAIGLAAALVAFDLLAWRVVAAMFDRERLVTGRRG